MKKEEKIVNLPAKGDERQCTSITTVDVAALRHKKEEENASLDLLELGFLARRGAELMLHDENGHPPRAYLRAFTSNLLVNRSQLLELSYSRSHEARILEILSRDLEQALQHPDYKLSAYTFATPGLEVVRPKVDQIIKEQLVFLSLAQALADECEMLEVSRPLVIGTSLETDVDSWFYRLLVSRDMNVVTFDAMARDSIMYSIEYGPDAYIYQDGCGYSVLDFYRYHIANLSEPYDSIMICNPELHYLCAWLHKDNPDLEIIDAASVQWELINDYLANKKQE